MAKARLIFEDRLVREDGIIIEMRIFQVLIPVPSSDHNLKYSLFCGRPGKRIVGYDNERGKGDHKHIKGKEFPYRFVSARQLIDDFKADVRKYAP